MNYKNDYAAGDAIMTNDRSHPDYPNGFPGTVVRVCKMASDHGAQMLEVRLPGGCCVRFAYDVRPAIV